MSKGANAFRARVGERGREKEREGERRREREREGEEREREREDFSTVAMDPETDPSSVEENHFWGRSSI